MNNENKSALSWFEIPVLDMKRAVAFYEATLGVEMKQELFAGVPNAIFPYQREAGVGGALFCDGKRKPVAGGAVVYLPVGDVKEAAARAKKAGGTVIADQIDIGDPGFIALVVDTEGNHVGLHTPRL
jgi:predicted enzyme related to lactoylglutathione lyase